MLKHSSRRCLSLGESRIRISRKEAFRNEIHFLLEDEKTEEVAEKVSPEYAKQRC